jgi:phosphonate transport system permease protein
MATRTEIRRPPRPALPARTRALRVLGVIAAVLLFIRSWNATGVSISALVHGYHNMADILSRAWPPKLNVLRDSISGAIETFEMAIVGTVGAIVLSFVAAPLAARNTTPHPIVYAATRTVFAVTRAVPDLIFALIFVTAVGLGPFAGVLALVVHSLGMLGKLYAEAIEELDPGPLDGLRVSGASRLQVFLHGVVPAVAPQLVGLSLYRFDVNFRSSLVLGFVGAGGIGFLIYNSMELFQYQEVTTELLVVLVFVLAVEWFSAASRKRLSTSN